MDAVLQDLTSARVEWEQNCSMALRSSFHIGGNAALGVFPKTRDELICALRILLEHRIPMHVVGNASNVVFSDTDFAGAVIWTNRCRSIERQGAVLTVSAGASLSAVSLAARDAGLTGAEFAYGIPGTVGGAVFMNAGAFGGCMEQICIRSDYFNTSDGTVGSYFGAEQCFGSRTSLYAKRPELVILGASLSLQRGERTAIAEQMEELASRRRATQPLELPSAGSVFKRPEGHFAGQLIEACGLKGMRVGGAQVSEKHAGFIVNLGGATASEVRCLVEQIRETVYAKTGVLLECEIQFL